MKAYKIVITIVSILLATIAVVFLILNSPATLFSYQGGPTRNDYQTLEKYSVKLVKNDNFELDEDINVEKSISKDYIIVKLDKPFYGIEAKFPMINYKENVDNDKFTCSGIINYDEVEYNEYTSVEPSWKSTISAIFITFVFTFVLIGIFYVIPVRIVKKQLTTKNTNKINKENPQANT